jgi:hypothetical protein
MGDELEKKKMPMRSPKHLYDTYSFHPLCWDASGCVVIMRLGCFVLTRVESRVESQGQTLCGLFVKQMRPSLSDQEHHRELARDAEDWVSTP